MERQSLTQYDDWYGFPMTYTQDDLIHCVGFKCIFNEYLINGDWKYSGVIIEVLEKRKYPCMVVVKKDEDSSHNVVSLSKIWSIPYYDQFKNTSLFRLIKKL